MGESDRGNGIHHPSNVDHALLNLGPPRLRSRCRFRRWLVLQQCEFRGEMPGENREQTSFSMASSMNRVILQQNRRSSRTFKEPRRRDRLCFLGLKVLEWCGGNHVIEHCLAIDQEGLERHHARRPQQLHLQPTKVTQIDNNKQVEAKQTHTPARSWEGVGKTTATEKTKKTRRKSAGTPRKSAWQQQEAAEQER